MTTNAPRTTLRGPSDAWQHEPVRFDPGDEFEPDPREDELRARWTPEGFDYQTVTEKE